MGEWTASQKRWLAVGIVAALVALRLTNNDSEARGEEAGRDQVYRAESDRRSYIRAQLCEGLEQYPASEVERDRNLVADAFNAALEYDPDGRNIIGFQDSYVIETVVRDCPTYLGAVIAEVDDWIEYQGEGRYGY